MQWFRGKQIKQQVKQNWIIFVTCNMQPPMRLYADMRQDTENFKDSVLSFTATVLSSWGGNIFDVK